MNADIIPARTPAEIFLARAFDASKAGLPGNPDVAKWREASFKAFKTSGLPHRRIETWHYTDLRTLMRDALPLATAPPPAAHFCRSALLIGAGASLRLAESMHFANLTQTVRAGQANACLVVSLDNGAKLAHTAMVTGPAPGGMRLESVMARIGARAKFDSFALVAGIGLVRRQMFVRVEGAESETSLNGVSLLGGREHADTTLRVEHVAPRWASPQTL